MAKENNDLCQNRIPLDPMGAMYQTHVGPEGGCFEITAVWYAPGRTGSSTACRQGHKRSCSTGRAYFCLLTVHTIFLLPRILLPRILLHIIFAVNVSAHHTCGERAMRATCHTRSTFHLLRRRRQCHLMIQATEQRPQSSVATADVSKSPAVRHMSASDRSEVYI